MKRPFSKFRPKGPFVSADDESDILTDLDIPKNERVEVYFHSSASMRELQNKEVSLMITSPPYNFGWDYGSFEDESEYVDYLSMLARVFTEAYKKLTPEGRLCVNIPTIDKRTGREGENIPMASDLISIMVQPSSNTDLRFNTEAIHELNRQTNYKLAEHIIWNKGRFGDHTGLASLGGGRGRPFRFKLDSTNESILVFQKPGKRDLDKIPDRLIKASELDSSWWLTLSGGGQFATSNKDDVWNIRPSGTIDFNGESIPTFPEEIPKRLIEAYSYKGDIVVDPFLGAGTTVKVAKELDRIGAGYELREELRPLIEERVNERV